MIVCLYPEIASLASTYQNDHLRNRTSNCCYPDCKPMGTLTNDVTF